ncbi:MAG: HNH endonuclease signature motif containing protein [Chloroflexales bacterium]
MLSPEIRLPVRQRAHFACEYCGVTEIDSAGELTIDHYQPPRHGGATDDPQNLLYCCARCNQYKSDYWPLRPTDVSLWNPRREQCDQHMLALADGTLYPITDKGTFTIRRLRLNRPPLVAYRLNAAHRREETHLLEELRLLIKLQEDAQQQHASLLREQQALLEQQRALLTILLKLLHES